MADIEELYQEIILEHNRHPRHFGPLADATHRADGLNPLCGDEITVFLKVEDSRIAEIAFQGQGCAISKASASMMTELLAGLPVEAVRPEVERIIGAFRPGGPDLLLDADGEVASLLGVRSFPARIKCATLAWHAVLCALDGIESVSTETDH